MNKHKFLTLTGWKYNHPCQRSSYYKVVGEWEYRLSNHWESHYVNNTFDNYIASFPYFPALGKRRNVPDESQYTFVCRDTFVWRDESKVYADELLPNSHLHNVINDRKQGEFASRHWANEDKLRNKYLDELFEPWISIATNILIYGNKYHCNACKDKEMIRNFHYLLRVKNGDGYKDESILTDEFKKSIITMHYQAMKYSKATQLSTGDNTTNIVIQTTEYIEITKKSETTNRKLSIKYS